MAKESTEERQERTQSATSPEELEKLAADEDGSVRSGVAYNPNTPASALEKLAADEDEDVRMAEFPMMSLVNDFETRVRILSNRLRRATDMDELIQKVYEYGKNQPREQLDGRTHIGTLCYEKETEDLIVVGRKGPSTWIGKYIAKLYPGKRIKVSWLSLDWERGKVIYCYDEIKQEIEEETYR